MRWIFLFAAVLSLFAGCAAPKKPGYQHPSHQQQIEGSDRAIRALDRQ